jgi:S-adenosylmethionine:tRNA ribosyltransferase-isomerase
MAIKTEEFDYIVPRELIAQHPVSDRPSSRLLVMKRGEKGCEHRQFKDITGYLRKGDVLVLNNTKVIRAKLTGRKASGGLVDILLVEKLGDTRWSCLIGGVKRGAGYMRVDVNGTAVQLEAGTPFWTVEFPEVKDASKIIDDCGNMPLPRYIKRGKNGNGVEDYARYQTVYAVHEGSIAAPTAGLHFDHRLLEDIQGMGVSIVTITLHIGVGTFFLIKAEYVEGHEMHRESYSVSPDTIQIIRDAKRNGGRVIAVGTSAVRTLETIWPPGNGTSPSGCTGLFIYPGYSFKVVDALVTNFHLPRSTPLMLVSAFAGKEAVQAAYREAVEQGYRFYSYGDAMFVS